MIGSQEIEFPYPTREVVQVGKWYKIPHLPNLPLLIAQGQIIYITGKNASR